MTITEIIQEIPKLKAEEREEIQACLDGCAVDCNDEDGESLSLEERAMIEARLEDWKKHPEKSISLEEFESRLNVRHPKVWQKRI